MKYIVVCGVDLDNDGKTDFKWPEVEVEAKEKWAALIKVAEGLGVSKGIPMSHLWKHSSIKQKDRKRVSKRRLSPEYEL